MRARHLAHYLTILAALYLAGRIVVSLLWRI